MKSLVLKAAAWLSDLRVAIVLLLLIAACSGLGTAIPQGEPAAFYHERYDAAPWLGVVNGDQLLSWELDHLYTSNWFLLLLAWLGLALLLCSLRRQWPALRASLRWLDYTKPRQLSKLAVATSLDTGDSAAAIDALEQQLQQQGWAVRRQQNRLAARRGVIGRVGPLLVHTGLIVFMVGAVVGPLAASGWSASWLPAARWNCSTPKATPGWNCNSIPLPSNGIRLAGRTVLLPTAAGRWHRCSNRAGVRERESPAAASRHHRLPGRLGPGGSDRATGPKPAAAAAVANLPRTGGAGLGLGAAHAS